MRLIIPREQAVGLAAISAVYKLAPFVFVLFVRLKVGDCLVWGNVSSG